MPYSSGVIGPFSQTLFLGASIVKFSANAGWNANASELTVELVEDPRRSTKLYYNSYCNPSIHTGPDRFNPPPLGSPVYFKYGTFSFAGIIQNWVERNSTDGKLYTVRITSPHDILEGSTVILDSYTGSVFGVPNMLNVFGYLEDFGTSLSTTKRIGIDSDIEIIVGYLPASGFGGASQNTVGLPWREIREGLAYIINAMSIANMSASNFNPMTNADWLRYGTRLSLVGYDYLYDILSLPSLDFAFRFSEESISLLDLTSKVCEYTSCDYILDLQMTLSPSYSSLSDYRPASLSDDNPWQEGTVEWANYFAGHLSAKGLLKFIRVVPVSRLKQLTPSSRIDLSTGSPISLRLNRWGTITSAVNTRNLPVNTNNRGLEFRNEVTNCFVVGENRQDVWQVFHGTGINLPGGDISFAGNATLQCIRTPVYGDSDRDAIWQYWGKDDNNFPIRSSGIGILHQVTLDLHNKFDLMTNTIILNCLGSGMRYDLDIMEATALLTQDKDCWVNYVQNRSIYNALHPEQFVMYNGGTIAVRLPGGRMGFQPGAIPGLFKTNDATLDWWNDNTGMKKRWLGQGSAKPYHLQSTSREAAYSAGLIGSNNPTANRDTTNTGADVFYAYLSKLVNEYYGKKFLVKLPSDACGIRVRDEPLAIRTNYEIADGGWTDADSVIGLVASGDDLPIFENTTDGKLECFVHLSAMSGALDLSRFSKGNYLYNSGNYDAYVKARVDELVFMNPSGLTDPRAVISLDDVVFPFDIFVSQFDIIWTQPPIGSPPGTKATSKQVQLPAGQTRTYARNWYDTFAYNGGNLFNAQAGDDLMKYPFSPFPISPDAVALPLKNNRVCYGPWYAQKQSEWGPSGKTEYVRDPNLAPWNFGGTARMNIAGNIEAMSRVMQHSVSEVAGVTIPGSPVVRLGDALIIDGPSVTNIDISVDPRGGITTTYQMRTFTPNYGAFTKSKIDEMSRVGRNSTKLQRLIVQAKHEEFAGRKTVPYAGSTAFTKADRYNRSSSHNFIFASNQTMYLPSGEMTTSGVWMPDSGGAFYTWEEMADSGVVGISGDIFSTSCVITSMVNTDLRKALPEMRGDDNLEYLKRAGCEPLGIFRPFSTLSGELSLMATMPIHTVVEGSGGAFCADGSYVDTTESIGRYGLPPLYSGFSPPICATTLNPFLARGVSNRGYVLATGYNYGHDIDHVIRGSGFPDDLSILNFNDYDEMDWYRSMGLRAPIVVVGWGYDIEGKPVPNARVDQSGNAMTNYFEQHWLRKPDKWKAGPLDIRWDQQRGMWTVPQIQNMIRFYAVENYDSSKTTFRANVQNIPSGYAYYNASGDLVPPVVEIYNPWGRAMVSGMAGWAYYNPNLNYTTEGHFLSKYQRYELITIDQPIATLMTTGGGSGVIYSVTMSPPNANVKLMDWNPVKILNAPDISGYFITAQLNSILADISPGVSGHMVFIPTDYPTPVEGAIMQSSTTAVITRVSGLVNVNNSLNIASGLRVNVQWNGLQWVTVNAEGYNTPVLGQL